MTVTIERANEILRSEWGADATAVIEHGPVGGKLVDGGFVCALRLDSENAVRSSLEYTRRYRANQETQLFDVRPTGNGYYEIKIGNRQFRFSAPGATSPQPPTIRSIEASVIRDLQGEDTTPRRLQVRRLTYVDGSPGVAHFSGLAELLPV